MDRVVESLVLAAAAYDAMKTRRSLLVQQFHRSHMQSEAEHRGIHQSGWVIPGGLSLAAVAWLVALRTGDSLEI